jgi:Restriction endonuclease S subunits
MTPQELKNSILQLAIQGKLVEQRPEEGTAEELYQQIQASFVQENSEKRQEKGKPQVFDVLGEDFPFEIPKSWKWAHLGKIGYTNIGLTYSPQNISETGTIVLRSSNIQGGKIAYNDIVHVNMDIPENKLCNQGDILICARNGSKRLVGKAAIVDEDGMSFGAFMAIFRSICNNYILYVIDSSYFRNSLLADTGTTTINQITQDMLKNALIPLPPLAEQKRIVAKIEELLPYIDRYEQAWSKLEDFNKRFPTDMQKSILQMAIQGKLVEQRPEEGTGEELYRQIQAEKQKLIKAGTIKKEKPLPEITEDEKPFDIPASWKWARLRDLAENIGDGIHGTPEFNPVGGYYFINGNNLDDGVISYKADTQQVGKGEYEKYKEPLTQNTVLISINGTIGNIAYYNNEPVILGKSACYIALCMGVYKYYIRTLLDSKFFLDYAMREATQTTIKNVSLKAIRMLPVPLPPFAEQKRIVAKLEEILPLYERLK